MHERSSAVKRSAQHDREGSNYNPFRRLRNRYRQYHLDENDGRLNHQHLPSPPTKTLVQEDSPRIYGQLFSSTESTGDDPAAYQSTAVKPLPGTSSIEKPAAQIDEEKSSIPRAEATFPPKHSLRQLNLLRWKRYPFESFSQDTETSEWIQGHCDDDPIPIRRRRVVVAEYGNTDNVTEGCFSDTGAESIYVAYHVLVTAENVRQSWNDPEYSVIEVPGYSVDENGQQGGRKSPSLAKPLEDALCKVGTVLAKRFAESLFRQFMPQQGASNLRIFHIQDDREAFLSLGHAFHMSFIGHRNNFRAWAIGPSQPLWEQGQRQLLEEYVGHLYPMQTVFWRPNRTGTGVRTAFGMEYPVLRLPKKALGPEQDFLQGQVRLRRDDVFSLPETSEQRLSVYIQLKKPTLKPQDPPEPDLGLDENTIVILDSMRKNLTSEELLDGLIPWKSLMYNADVEDPLVGNPVLIAAVRLIFDAVAAKWSDYILSWLNYVAILEELIYSQPADDKYSPLLWESSKRLQQAERLLKFHILLLENVQHELADITGPNTMEPDWLRQNLKEFSRLSSEVEESLRKPVAQMVDLMYKSIGIRDARQSLELNTSLFRLSWITFIFLPLTFLAGIFGMNVSEMHSNPPLKWYFATAVPLMVVVMIAYLSARKLMRKDVTITQPSFQSSPPNLRTM